MYIIYNKDFTHTDNVNRKPPLQLTARIQADICRGKKKTQQIALKEGIWNEDLYMRTKYDRRALYHLSNNRS